MKKIPIPIPGPERLAALAGVHAPSCWLDSAMPGHPRARFSLLSVAPCEVFRSTGRELEENFPAPLSFAQDAELPFSGGWVGFTSYECFAEARLRHASVPGLPEAFFLRVDSGIVIDHVLSRAWIFSQGSEAEASERCRFLQKALEAALSVVSRVDISAPLRVNTSREAYLEKVQEIREAIFRGDCYQVNLSQSFESRGDWDAAEFYLRLRRRAPAPHMAFLNAGDFQILSASPETLLQIEGDRIASYPIKGTRPRHAEPARDAEAAHELELSEKDAAELLMIVDLVRNDLGKFCRTGSISVPSLGSLESFRTVHHRVAEVTGRLKAGVTPWEALRHLSPGGSITGTPKLKSMEMIRALEPGPRGIYTGSIGYVGADGNAAFNIAIRTAFLRGDSLCYAAGGGIVADSVPELEYEETLHKARAFFEALGASSHL